MTKVPDMPEVDPDDGEVERHDAHYRLNPSGHKELVVKKKGEQDEETLNELAEDLMEMAGDYEGLEDADKFEGDFVCDNCGEKGNYFSMGSAMCDARGRDNCEAVLCAHCAKNIEKTKWNIEVCSSSHCYQCPRCFTVGESITFGGPAPAMSPEQQGYQRNVNNVTPQGMADNGPLLVAGDHEAIRNAGDSPNNLTSTTAQAADGPERSRAKSRIGVRNKLGIGPRNKYIAGNRGDGGDGIDYGATHSESFTGTAAIAIGTYDVLDDDEDEDTDTSESLMANKKRILNEWEPKFAGGGDYDPGDYQMPSPTGDGVAERKPKQDKVGAYDTDTSNSGQEWPRDHNETAAMCDVDDDGVENKPQGSHESSVGDPKDGHQEEMGHNWPDEAKNSGSGVAEPFEGKRWSDGGTLKGSGQNELDNSGPAQKMPSSGIITGVSGPQLGEPQEGKWTPGLFATMMEGDVSLQRLFNSYAADGREAVCVEDFQMLIRAHGSGKQIDEQSLMQLMSENQQFLFYEGTDANGPYWVPTPLAEGKPFPGAAEPFGSDSNGDDSDSDDSDDSDSSSGKPWESGSSDDSDDDSGKPWESRQRGRAISEGRSRRPFGQTINELQRRPPEREVDLYRGGITDDPSITPNFDDPGMGGPEMGMGGPEMGMGMDGPGGPGMGMRRSEMGMGAALDACPECDYNGPGGEESCPECGAMIGDMGEEAIYGDGGMTPNIGTPEDVDDDDEFFASGDYDEDEITEWSDSRPRDNFYDRFYDADADPDNLEFCMPEFGSVSDADYCGLDDHEAYDEHRDPTGQDEVWESPEDPGDDDDSTAMFRAAANRPRAAKRTGQGTRRERENFNESLRNFMTSARNIIGHNKGQHRGSIAEALNQSWDYYAGRINPNRCSEKVQNSLVELMDKFPGFSPIAEDNEFTDSPESKAMDSSEGSAIGGGGSGSNKSSFLPEADSDTSDEGEAWPRSHKQQSSPEETPIIKGTEKGMTGTGTNAKTVKENVARLSKQVKKCLNEGIKGLRGGRFDVRFTCLVQESNGKINRTKTRVRLAEALADAEELLQVYPADQVVLESYFGRGGSCLRKYDIPLSPVKARGPLVSGDKALFRFNRTAERYAQNLVSEGFSCRVGSHNWGQAVQVLTEKRKWASKTKLNGSTMTESTHARQSRRRARRRRARRRPAMA
jgi:hypothetical protein